MWLDMDLLHYILSQMIYCDIMDKMSCNLKHGVSDPKTWLSPQNQEDIYVTMLKVGIEE